MVFLVVVVWYRSTGRSVEDANGSHLAGIAGDSATGGGGGDQLVSAAMVNAHRCADLAIARRVAVVAGESLDDFDQLPLAGRELWRLGHVWAAPGDVGLMTIMDENRAEESTCGDLDERTRHYSLAIES